MQGRITVFTFTEFGAVGDGANVDNVAIQKAINAAEQVSIDDPNRRAVVFGPDGTYLCAAALDMKDNATVICSPGCIFLRISGPGSEDRVSFDSITDATWIGGTFLRENDLVAGNIISIMNSSRITVKDIVVRGWQKDDETFISGWRNGRAIGVDGDDIRILNPTIRDPYKDANGKYEVATGGIRINGGKRLLCAGGYVESGDDAFAFVPPPPGTGANRSGALSVEDATVSDMTLWSRAARALNFALSTGDDEVLDPGHWSSSDDQPSPKTPVVYQTSSLTRCRISNIVARTDAGRGLLMRNDYSSGAIEDIEISNMVLHCGRNTGAPVQIRSKAGPVRRIRFKDVSIFVDPATAVDQSVVNVVRVDGFSWTGGRIDAPVRGAEPTVRLVGVVGGSLRDLSIGCHSLDGVRFDRDEPAPADEFGQVARDCAGVTITDSVIENIPSGGYGLNFVDASNCGAVRVRFTDGIAVLGSPSVPHSGTLSQLTATDPAVSRPSPDVEIYTVTIQAEPVVPLSRPLYFTVFRGAAAVGQGRVGVPFASAGLRFLLDGAALAPGDTIAIPLQTTGGKAATLGATASACFLDACDVSRMATAVAVDVANGRRHRVADLFPFDTPANYIGGLFEADNEWSSPQMFGSLSAKSLATGRSNVSINADKITTTAATMLLTAESGTTDDLFTVDGGAAGALLILRTAAGGQTITVKDTSSSGGNLRLGGSDFVLNTVDDAITLIRGASPQWYELARSNNL